MNDALRGTGRTQRMLEEATMFVDPESDRPCTIRIIGKQKNKEITNE